MTPASRQPPRRPTADLIERFSIRLPDGTDFEGSLHRTPHRASGRRIIVRDVAGRIVHDTDDCYDQGNAINGLDLWLAEQVKASATVSIPKTLVEAA